MVCFFFELLDYLYDVFIIMDGGEITKLSGEGIKYLLATAGLYQTSSQN